MLAQSAPINDSFKYQRKYPSGAMYGAVTGYFSSLYGATGIEQPQNSLLSGDDDDLIGDRFSDLITGRDPRGGNVQLSIVPRGPAGGLQRAQGQGLRRCGSGDQAEHRAILALATTPAYDPTPLASHYRSSAEGRVQADQLDQRRRSGSTGPPEPCYPPGSTFKLVVSGGRPAERLHPESSVTGEATMKLPGTGGATLSNFEGETCGDGGGADVTLTEALAHSCNTAFADARHRTGRRPDPSAGRPRSASTRPASTSEFPSSDPGSGRWLDDAAVAQSSIGQRDVALHADAERDRSRRPSPTTAAVGALSGGQDDETGPVGHFADPTRCHQPGHAVIGGRQHPRHDDPVGEGHARRQPVRRTRHRLQDRHGRARHDAEEHAAGVLVCRLRSGHNPQVAVAVLVENGGDLGLSATGGAVAGPIGHAVISRRPEAGQ